MMTGRLNDSQIEWDFVGTEMKLADTEKNFAKDSTNNAFKNIVKNALKNIVKKHGALLKVAYYSGVYFILDRFFDRKGVYIFCYHRLTDREPDSASNPMTVDFRSFEKHLRLLKKKFELIPLDQAVEYLNRKEKLKKRYAVVTFDDAYRDNYLYGREIFLEYGVKPTIYLPAGIIDQRTWLWHDKVDYMVFSACMENIGIDMAGIKAVYPLRTALDRRRLADLLKESLKRQGEDTREELLKKLSGILGVQVPEKCGLLLDWDELLCLEGDGAAMGGHTMSHPILESLPEEKMRQEVTDCKRMIEAHIRGEVCSFAYPNGKTGDYSQETVMEVRKHYKSAVTTMPGVNLSGADPYELRRIVIGEDPDVLMFRFKILQAKISGTTQKEDIPAGTKPLAHAGI